MTRKLFWILFLAILVFGFLLRIIPTQGNNFYFTIDQGNEAIHSREFWERGKLLTRGPETGIRGIFTLPGWYYFVSLGYWIFDKHPFGALFMVIVLNVLLTGVVMWQIRKHVNWWTALTIGAALQIQWAFYDTSRYAFNPFLLVACGFGLVFLLTSFLRGKAWHYMYAAIPVGLAFNAEIAGAAAMGVFYILFGAWAWFRKKLTLRTYFLSAFLLPGIFVLKMAWDAFRVWQATNTLPESNLNTFGGTNFLGVGRAFLEIVRDASIPQSTLLGVLGMLGVLGLFLRQKTQNTFVKNFVFLSLALYIVTFLFLGGSRGWQDWHDLFLPPLLFVSLLLVLWSIPQKAGFLLFTLIVGAQVVHFAGRYNEYLKPSDDPGILANQVRVVDWVYQNAENNGFNVYTYSQNKYDDHYQYVFWWYGRDAYKYLPCEYSFLPKAIKYLYVTGSELSVYSEPKLGCDKFVFLIMEPEVSGWDQKAWFEEAKTNTELLEEVTLGKIRIQKREYPDKISLSGFLDRLMV
ncbi:hypothetical protein A3A70_01350 [candidate division WWE3 bacterium RIFCSPLOWO2_01_FULL_42_11]|uniref:Glycosyltransferase RgtA/B/C/D-like domain-containing protein n=1 Tax=candidate division WWE3 bacterium RIFCSPLOWO2_01_FULL_42_11 TaxID=1802627 RepID=A0A1F4VQM9_UNCKA|nr:MAG: hypothetical protein A3A70_01350 [candidate division WWE3 bacterium RIFCSPLOWO2_01_FULL_42_11]